MPDITSLLLICLFLCFMTGLFSPDIILKWGIPCPKKRRLLLSVASVGMLLFFTTSQLKQTPLTTEEGETTTPNMFVFSPTDDSDAMKIYKVADTGFSNQLEIRVIQKETSRGNERYERKEGYEYVFLTVALANKTNESLVFQTEDLTMTTEQLEVLTPMMEATTPSQIELAAKEESEVSLVYLQPTTDTTLTLHYLPLSQANGEESPSEVVMGQMGDVIQTNHALLQIHEVKTLTKEAPLGKEYVQVSLSLKNSTDQTMTYYPFSFQLSSAQSATKIKPMTSLQHSNLLSMTELASGGLVSGNLLFEVPKGATDFVLNYDDATLFTKATVQINLMQSTQNPIPLQSDLQLSANWHEGNELDQMKLTVKNITFTSSTPYASASAQHQFMIIEVALANGGEVARDYSAFDFKLLTQQGKLVMPTLVLVDNEHELKNGTLNPGEEVSGYLLFEESDLYTSFYLLYSTSNWRQSDCLLKMIEN